MEEYHPAQLFEIKNNIDNQDRILQMKILEEINAQNDRASNAVTYNVHENNENNINDSNLIIALINDCKFTEDKITGVGNYRDTSIGPIPIGTGGRQLAECIIEYNSIIGKRTV